MRVTSGFLKGLSLKAPKGPPIRTTLDHVRQAIFNLLGERVKGVKVLDLFSGSGALGIEAFSRGASQVTFVDRSYFCSQAIQENIQAVSDTVSDADLPEAGRRVSEGCLTVLRADAIAAIRKLARAGEVFHLVLLDPPYGHRLARKSLNALLDYAILGFEGLVVAEHDKRDPLPDVVSGKEGRLALQRRQRYGDTALSIYEKQ